MISSALRRAVLAGALIAATVPVITAASASATAATSASQPQHKQIAVSALSSFKVILTATRGPGQPPMATVTAAGYRRAGTHWELIAKKRIGKANEWFWFSVQTCSLTTTQLQGEPPTVTDSIEVSLLITPAIGCSGTFSKHWKP